MSEHNRRERVRIERRLEDCAETVIVVLADRIEAMVMTACTSDRQAEQRWNRRQFVNSLSAGVMGYGLAEMAALEEAMQEVSG